jgi:hypothetical protein
MNNLVRAFERFGPSYLLKYGRSMLTGHFKALKNIQDCRTSTYGKWVGACTECGIVEEINGACRNRACPKCNNSRTQEWIDAQKARLPATAYHHLVFSVPSELRIIARRNQKVFFQRLLWAVSETLLAFGAGGRQVHGRIGFLTVLHTWDSKLNFHPHVHVLLMSGYLDPHGQWVSVERKHIFPNDALSSMYKTKFLKALRADLGENIPSRFWNLEWVVYTKKEFTGSTHVIEYLGRYVKRLGIGPSRVESVDKHGVDLRYRHRNSRNDHEWRTMKITGEEFMRRYLQHVLPKGFVRIRYYGLLNHHQADALAIVKAQVEEIVKEKEEGVEEEKTPRQCRVCMLPLVTLLRIIPAFFKVRQKKAMKFYSYKGRGEEPRFKGGGSASNNLFEPPPGGRHTSRLRETCAGAPSGPPPGAGLSASPSGPSSRLNSTLYGRGK